MICAGIEQVREPSRRCCSTPPRREILASGLAARASPRSAWRRISLIKSSRGGLDREAHFPASWPPATDAMPSVRRHHRHRITCHARAVAFSRADARTILEIGGQDSKGHQPRRRRRVRDFAMNDRARPAPGVPGNGRGASGDELGKSWRNWDAKAPAGAHQQYLAPCSPRPKSSPSGGRPAVAGRGGRPCKTPLPPACGRWPAGWFRRRYISRGCRPAARQWPALWRRFSPVRSKSRPARNTPAPSAPPSR